MTAEIIIAVAVLVLEAILIPIFWSIKKGIDSSNSKHDASQLSILHQFELQNQARDNTVRMVEKILERSDQALNDHKLILSKVDKD